MSAQAEDAPAAPKTGGAGEADAAPVGGSALPAVEGSPAVGAQTPRPRLPPEKLLELQRTRGEAHERLHFESCGRQITSVRSTNPVFTFGSPGRSTGAGRGSGRCREICDHPSNRNPASAYMAPTTDVGNTVVLKGWGQERRFPDDPSLTQASMSPIRHSTHASPFSRTYPYEEPGKNPKAGAAAPAAGADGAAEPGPPRPSLAPAEGAAQPDYNVLRCQFPRTPQWSFGSSGLGLRFRTGTSFSRQPHIGVSTRQLTFRELRATGP